MKWRFPFSRIARTGILTKDKPIAAIRDAGEEVQALCVTAADFAVDGMQADATVENNVLKVRGSVAGGDLEARVYALEKALAEATVKVDLALSNDELSATGTVTWGGTGAKTDSEEGTPVEVTDCDDEGGA